MRFISVFDSFNDDDAYSNCSVVCSLREDLTARFESQIKLSLQETVKSEVQGVMQELKVTQMRAPVSESVPQQNAIDPKVRSNLGPVYMR